MGLTIKLCAVVLLCGLALEYAYGQMPPRPNVVGIPANGFGKRPPPLDSKKLADARNRLKSLSFSPSPCNLRKVPEYKDPAIMGTSDPGKRASGIPSGVMNMAIKRAVRRGGEEANAAKALMDSSRQIQASKARAMNSHRNRTKRQAEHANTDMAYLADTMATEICTPKEKLVMSVMNDGTQCYTIQPQEVKMWECASKFARGMVNPFPFMQKYYCEPGNYVNTYFYVVCPFKQPNIRIQELVVPINCGCATYQCNFEPYQAEGVLTF